jgi:hypothetical protein
MEPILTGDKNVNTQILNSLNDKELLSYCSSNKAANLFCKNEDFWKVRVFGKFGKYLNLEIINKYRGNRKWSEYYIELATKLNSKYDGYELAKAMEGKREDIEVLLTRIKGTMVTFSKDDDYEYYRTADWIPRLEGKYIGRINGKIHQEGEYKLGVKIGTWKTYFSNGNINTINNYRNWPAIDNLHGEQLQYDENWNDGILLNRKFYQ